MDKKILVQMLANGKTIRQISLELGKGYTTIRYYLKKYGLKPAYSCFGKRKWSHDEMVAAIAGSETISDVLRKVGLKIRPGNYDTIRRFVKKNSIDVSHMKGSKAGRGGVAVINLNKLLTKDSICTNKSRLKQRLLKEGILENKCSECGLGSVWNNKAINMVIDHINGDTYDYRLENLRMLCPNCNSQQDTFCRGHGRYVKSLKNRL
jgi:Zn finger protein HypA/HybF involved in hydrogenase expression